MQNSKIKMQNYNPKFKLKKQGFTLLETLVAISVLIMATVGPMTLASQSIRNASLLRNQTIAYFLAEEAAEYIHNRVDTNSFTPGTDWLFGLDACLGGGSCRVDALSGPSDSAVSCFGPCGPLKFDDTPGVGLYGYGQGDDSLFTRTITMNEIADNVEVKIVIRVEWSQGGATRNASIEEHLFNWR